MLKMPNKIDTENCYKGINLQTLREREQALISTHSWWTEKISKAASDLEKESNSLTPNYEKVSNLEKELEYLQAKGSLEQREVDKFSKIKESYLLTCLLSGISSIKIN